MDKDTRNIILGAIITAIITSSIAVSLHFLQEASIEKQIENLNTQNNLLNATLQDQEKQTKIMNQTLANLKKSLEKESLISVKVLPYTDYLDNPFGSGYSLELGGGKIEREIYPVKSSITLRENTTMKFDVVVTNTGTDTAILNSYLVQVIADGDPYGNSITTKHEDIKVILEANSDPLIIPLELEILPSYSPSGEIFFVVSHDNGVDESYSLKYRYED